MQETTVDTFKCHWANHKNRKGRGMHLTERRMADKGWVGSVQYADGGKGANTFW